MPSNWKPSRGPASTSVTLFGRATRSSLDWRSSLRRSSHASVAMFRRAREWRRLTRRQLALLLQHRVVFLFQLGADLALLALRHADDGGGNPLLARQRPRP